MEVLQKISIGLGITSPPIDIMVWLDTEEKYLELSAYRINRRLHEDNICVSDVCRFTKRDVKGKNRPQKNEIYHYGMRIRFSIIEEEYERVVDALENGMWATSPMVDLRPIIQSYMKSVPKVDIKKVWVERLSDVDVREKLSLQEDLNEDLKKQHKKMVDHTLQIQTENDNLKAELENLKADKMRLDKQVRECRCNGCYIQISGYTGVV